MGLNLKMLMLGSPVVISVPSFQFLHFGHTKVALFSEPISCIFGLTPPRFRQKDR